MTFDLNNMQFCFFFLCCCSVVLCENARHHAFVCVTGQLSRFELQSKMTFFFVPNVAAGVLFHVNLVLSPTSRHVTNRRSGISGWRSHDLGDIVSAFESLRINVHVDIREQTSNPPINAAYLKQLDKLHLREDERIARVQNHYRQWEALSRCWDGVAMDTQYDSFVRLRDDSLFWSPMILTHFRGAPGVHVPHCNSWWGINDRGAIVLGSDFARVYFTQMLIHWNESLTIDVVNPETYMAAILRKNYVPIYVNCGYFFTFLSSHIGRKNETCTTWHDRGASPPSPFDLCAPKLLNFCAPPEIVLPPLCSDLH